MVIGACSLRLRVIAVTAVVFFIASCASAPRVAPPTNPSDRLDHIDATLAMIGDIATDGLDPFPVEENVSAGTVPETVLLDLSGDAREPLLHVMALPANLERRLERACLLTRGDGARSIWLEGRFGLLAVSVAMSLEGYPRSGDRSWLTPEGEVFHESRGILRIDRSSTASWPDRRGREIFSRWRAEAPELMLAIRSADPRRLPMDLKDAQAPFLPEELLAIAWSVGNGVELALRTRFAEERTARVALVATRLGARRTIDRFQLRSTEAFAIDRRGSEIDVSGVVAPWETVRIVATMIEGGRW